MKEIFKKEKLETKDEIKKWLDFMMINNYTINDDLTVDVEGDVDISRCRLKTIPINFNLVNGAFDCSNNELSSLIGSPKEVTFNFKANSNQLTSLMGSPKKVGGNFNVFFNQLSTLEGSPKIINGSFDCSHNKLDNLVGGPNIINDHFDVRNNNLKDLKGSPKEVYGDFNCSGCKLESLDGVNRVGGIFDCCNNFLITLSNGPLGNPEIGRADFNPLLSLESDHRLVVETYRKNVLQTILEKPRYKYQILNCSEETRNLHLDFLRKHDRDAYKIMLDVLIDAGIEVGERTKYREKSKDLDDTGIF